MCRRDIVTVNHYEFLLAAMNKAYYTEVIGIASSMKLSRLCHASLLELTQFII